MAKRKNEKKEMKYLVETTEAVSYILDRTCLEMMLVSLWSPEDIVSLGYAVKKGWYVGNDNRIYENIDLNEKGDLYYKHAGIEQKSIIPIEAIQEMNANPQTESYAGVKFRLKEFFSVNEIFSISRYEGKELVENEKPPQKQKTSDQKSLWKEQKLLFFVS